MTLKQQLKPLSEVSLEDAKKIIKDNRASQLMFSNGTTYLSTPNSINALFSERQIHIRSVSGIDREVDYRTYLIANKLGYYIPKLSEELKIAELVGILKMLAVISESVTKMLDGKETVSDLAILVYKNLSDIEKQISELKQGE